MSSNLVQYECKDCNSSWAACGASICFNSDCLSDNIFIYWYPGKPLKPDRIKLKTKPKKIQLKTKIRRIKLG